LKIPLEKVGLWEDCTAMIVRLQKSADASQRTG